MKLTKEEALKILDGDFTGIEKPEGETCATIFAAAFQMAKDALKSLDEKENKYESY